MEHCLSNKIFKEENQTRWTENEWCGENILKAENITFKNSFSKEEWCDDKNNYNVH